MLERQPKDASESKTLKNINYSNHLLHAIIGLSFVGAITWDYLDKDLRAQIAQKAAIGMGGISLIARFVNRNAYLARILGPGDIVTSLGKLGLDPPAKDNLIVHFESSDERDRYQAVKEFIQTGKESAVPIPESVAEGLKNSALAAARPVLNSLNLQDIVSDVHEQDLSDESDQQVALEAVDMEVSA